MPTFAALENSEILGFLSLNLHNEFNAEIHVMGVGPEHHSQGVGQALIKRAEEYARAQGCRFLTVKTLSPARTSAEYDLTRRFYLKYGFVLLEEFKTLWGEANPCLLMIKTI
jgi:ribosomal protein S18 acetylase RimI-like enzyme